MAPVPGRAKSTKSWVNSSSWNAVKLPGQARQSVIRYIDTIHLLKSPHPVRAGEGVGPESLVEAYEAQITWVNSLLEKSKRKCISDLCKMMADGSFLPKILEIVTCDKMPEIKEKPGQREEKLHNLHSCLIFLKKKGVDLSDVTAENIANGEMTPILTLLHNIRLVYDPEYAAVQYSNLLRGIMPPPPDDRPTPPPWKNQLFPQSPVNGYYSPQSQTHNGTPSIIPREDRSSHEPPHNQKNIGAFSGSSAQISAPPHERKHNVSCSVNSRVSSSETQAAQLKSPCTSAQVKSPYTSSQEPPKKKGVIAPSQSSTEQTTVSSHPSLSKNSVSPPRKPKWPVLPVTFSVPPLEYDNKQKEDDGASVRLDKLLMKPNDVKNGMYKCDYKISPETADMLSALQNVLLPGVVNANRSLCCKRISEKKRLLQSQSDIRKCGSDDHVSSGGKLEKRLSKSEGYIPEMPSAEKMPESPSIEDRLKSLFAQQEHNSHSEKQVQEKSKAKTTMSMGPPKPPRSPSLNHTSNTAEDLADSVPKTSYKPSQHAQKAQGPRGERLMNGPTTKMTYAQNDNYLYDLDICTCGLAQNHEVTEKSQKAGKMNEITSTDLRHACNRMFISSPSNRNNQITSTNNQAVNPAFLPDEEHSKGGQNLSLNANSKLYHNQSPVMSARNQQSNLPTQHMKSSNQHSRSGSQGFNTDIQETFHNKTASLPRQNGHVHSYMNLQQNPHAASLRAPTPTPYSNNSSHKNGPDHGNSAIVNGHVPRLQTHKYFNERSGSEPPKVSPKPNLDTRSGHIRTGIVYPKPQQPSPRSLTRNEPLRRSTNDYDKVVSDNNVKNLSNVHIPSGRIPTPLALIMKSHGKGIDKPSQNRRYSEDSETEGSSLTPPLPPLSADESSYLSEVESGRPNSHHDSRLTPDLLDAMPRKDKSKKVKRAPSVTTGNKKWTGGEKLKKRKKKRSHNVSATSLNSGSPSADQLKIDYTSDEEEESSDSNYTSGVESSEVNGLRKQIEGMELMYWELLKTLGVKNEVMEKIQNNVRNTQIQQAGKKGKKSALVLQHQRTKDVRAVNRRFSRLESHVVTLARSVAHLSSEMRSQNLIVEDMETMKKEVRELTKYVKPRGHRAGRRHDVENFRLILPGLTNPHRVEKLAKFFGEKPPLLHMFLKKLGYEHYIPNFDMENISMIELPYMDDHQLEKIGIPLGPRMRILQEAQLSLQQDNDMGPTLSSNVYFI